MALEKLKIQVETAPNKFDQEIVALFNPAQITIEKTVNWKTAAGAQRDCPTSQFTNAEPAILTMDLVFDTYETGGDVRDHTDKVLHLGTVEKHGSKHRPPIFRLAWGTTGVFFQGVLQKLSQKFTLFLPDGTPVRATLSCTFKQWRTDKEESRRQNKQSVDVAKTHTVKRGDTLSGIADREYHDPALWRPIAEANRIVNPLRLEPGSVLIIPTLPQGATRTSDAGR
jgi:nucleoid-associated protein YgaU